MIPVSFFILGSGFGVLLCGFFQDGPRSIIQDVGGVMLPSLYGFVKDWQTVVVTFPTLMFAIYAWEVDKAVKVLDNYYANCTGQGSKVSFPDSQLARRLSNLPNWLAARVAAVALLKCKGNLISARELEDFRKNLHEQKAIRRNLRDLGL